MCFRRIGMKCLKGCVEIREKILSSKTITVNRFLLTNLEIIVKSKVKQSAASIFDYCNSCCEGYSLKKCGVLHISIIAIAVNYH